MNTSTKLLVSKKSNAVTETNEVYGFRILLYPGHYIQYIYINVPQRNIRKVTIVLAEQSKLKIEKTKYICY